MFEGLGLECYAKTSGSKGMQVYLPLNSEATFAQTKAFSKAVAELLAREEPGLVVARQTKSARTGKVLVDWGQNDVNKTTINAYSMRAMARPTVSTAVTWDEVRAAKAPEDLTFEAADVLRRVDEHGDLFAPVLKMKQRLPKVNRMSSELAEHYGRYASKLKPAASARTSPRAKKRG